MTDDAARGPQESALKNLLDGQIQTISAVTPGRLAAPTPREAQLTLMKQDWWQHAHKMANEWQAISVWAEFWEIGLAPRAQYGRAHELAGLIASGGEQLALALGATVEAELWSSYRQDTPDEVQQLDEIRQRAVFAANEMAHRAMAELAAYYLLATGHVLANVTIRVLALDSQLHAALFDAFGAWCPVNSEDSRDWLSLNRETVRMLRRIAKKAATKTLQSIAEPATTLIQTPSWQQLSQLRGAHYHRRRPQSAGIAGVPLASPWVFSNGTASIEGGGREYTDGEGLARETTDLTRHALFMLSDTMGSLLELVNSVIAEIQQKHRGALAPPSGRLKEDQG